MIRMIVAPLLALTAAAGAQTCVYKDVMTDADIEACRHPAPAPKQMRPSPAPAKSTAPLDTSAAGYEARLDAENARQRVEGSAYTRSVAARAKADQAAAQQAAIDAAPSEPKVGMTTDEAQAMLLKNQKYTHNTDWMYCNDKNKTTNASGVHEQWVCGSEYLRTFMYFDNGVLTSFQSH